MKNQDDQIQEQLLEEQAGRESFRLFYGIINWV